MVRKASIWKREEELSMAVSQLSRVWGPCEVKKRYTVFWPSYAVGQMPVNLRALRTGKSEVSIRLWSLVIRLVSSCLSPVGVVRTPVLERRKEEVQDWLGGQRPPERVMRTNVELGLGGGLGSREVRGGKRWMRIMKKETIIR